MICQTTPVLGQLNAFQKVMLQWSSLHPYNASHVYKIAGPLRSSDLAEAVASTFDATAWESLTFRRMARRFGMKRRSRPSRRACRW